MLWGSAILQLHMFFTLRQAVPIGQPRQHPGRALLTLWGGGCAGRHCFPTLRAWRPAEPWQNFLYFGALCVIFQVFALKQVYLVAHVNLLNLCNCCWQLLLCYFIFVVVALSCTFMHSLIHFIPQCITLV
jgi:hypothetical protein